MAQLNINIPDNKVAIILEAFHEVRGIDETPAAFKAEIINEIKQTVKNYRAGLKQQEDPDIAMD